MPSATCPDASQYRLGNDALILFGSTLLTGSTATPTSFNITLNAAVSALDTSITVLALPNPVYRGDRLRFSNGDVVQVNADAIATATTISILPATSSISNSLVAAHYPMVVFESANSVKFSFSGDTAEIRNLGGCDWASFLMTKRSATITIDGHPMDGDLGAPLIRQAAASRTGRLFVQVIEPDGRLFQAPCWVQTMNADMTQDQPFKRDYTLQVSGQPLYGTATDVVLT